MIPVQSLQKEIERHAQQLHEIPDHHMAMEPAGPPLSPRQRPTDDDSRRSSIASIRPGPAFRPPAPPYGANPPRRHGPSNLGNSSPSSLRPQPSPLHLTPHPLSSYQSPQSHLTRRHTAADIRVHQQQSGWQSNSPFSGLGQSSLWPPSPGRPPNAPEFREPNYDAPSSRPPAITTQTAPESNGENHFWQTHGNAKFGNLRDGGHTAPPTRRSSLATNSVHALLNPPDAMDRDGHSDGENDDRKRKRMI